MNTTIRFGSLVAIGLALAASALNVQAQTACSAVPGSTRVAARNVVVLYQPRPAPIKVGELFALDLAVCVLQGEVSGVRVDASMPEHKHGMNYKPVVSKKAAADVWSATGLMFHMPGRWQFAFEVETSSGRERLLHNVTLE